MRTETKKFSNTYSETHIFASASPPPDDSIILDASLAACGKQKIEWAARHMPVLNKIFEQYREEQPFEGLKIGMSIHMEAKTAHLAEILHACGAEVYATGCNTLSTQDDVAAALASSEVHVFAKYGVSEEEYSDHLNRVVGAKPDLFIDDGGDLLKVLMEGRVDWTLLGGCEETTTGVKRIRSLERNRKRLPCPMINVNDAGCKHLFDNRYGTGQSVWTAIMTITNTLIAGKTVVVAGYGWCGKGVAMRAKALGARVVVTEIDSVKALEAKMDGFEVRRMENAVSSADYIVTETGCKDVLTAQEFLKLKDGVILANGGHFDVEINLQDLRSLAANEQEVRWGIREFTLENGRRVYVLVEGKLVNLAGGDGHPAEIMDMSFSVQFLSLLYLARNRKTLIPCRLLEVPKEIDLTVAQLKLEAMGVEIDKLTDEQWKYYYG